MGEDRFGVIKEAVVDAKKIGLPPRDRRDFVIEKVAVENLSQEPTDVKKTAINKYFEIINPDASEAVLIVVPHHGKPGEGELFALLRDAYPEKTAPELNEAIKNWLDAPNNQKPHKIVTNENPNYHVYQSISAVRNTNEKNTLELAQEIAGGRQALTILKAKKSRMFGDSNRRPFFKEPRGVKQSGERFIHTREFPTSIRAAWYFALEKLKKPNEPFLQLVIHGMEDRVNEAGETAYDFVVGAGDRQKGQSGQLAGETVLNWFAQELAKKLGRDELKVALNYLGEPNAVVFEGAGKGKIISSSVPKVGESLSGGGLGLELFRSGGEITPEGQSKTFKIPGFGDQMNTIQLEVSKRVRTDPELRQKTAAAIRKICLEFPKQFK